jgi:hypothetical protein
VTRYGCFFIDLLRKAAGSCSLTSKKERKLQPLLRTDFTPRCDVDR